MNVDTRRRAFAGANRLLASLPPIPGLGSAAVPAVDSPEFWRRVERTPVSLDPDQATAQVVRRMCELVRSSAAEPLFRAWAETAVRQFRGGPMWAAAGIDPLAGNVAPADRALAVAESFWWWAKQFIHFVHHNAMIWERLREVNQWQLLISPDVLGHMAEGRIRLKGDCAIFSMCIAAMLEAYRLPWELKTDACDPEQPGVYSHVYPRVILPDGRRVALDASHGRYPGWHVPAYDVTRAQVWDRNGRPVEDRGRRFTGLHRYTFRRRGGLGAVDCNWTDEFGQCITPGPGDTVVSPGGTRIPVGGGSGSGFDFGGLFSDLAKRWTDIGGRVVAPQTTYTQRGPGGQMVTYSTPGGGSSLFPGPSILGSGGSTWVWVAGGLGVLLLAGVALKK